mgnify:CR=1 FL=1
MCFTVSDTKEKTKKAIFDYINSNPGMKMHFNFDDFEDKLLVSDFSHSKLPIVKQVSIELGECGVVPSFIAEKNQEIDIQNKTLNTRADSIRERKSFRNAIVNQRCVLVVDGFVEWRHTPERKIPYYIYPKDETVFYLGCIYNSYANKETGEVKDTFSILTTKANPMMEFVHNSKKRMPLIFGEDNIATWINPNTVPEQVNLLMRSYDENRMKAHSISREASYAGKDRNYPEIKDAVEYNDPTQMNLFDYLTKREQ